MQKPWIVEGDDGSLVFEWISKDKRFGLCIEKNIEESSWYFVSKDPYECEGQKLPEEMIEFLKKYFE